MFAVTGASGHLGRLVLDARIAEVPASQVVASPPSCQAL